MMIVRCTSAIVIMILADISLHAVDNLGSDGPVNAELDLKEHEPQTRTLVWAKPGASGSVFDLENWIEYASTGDDAAGKPGRSATKAPDAKTDVVLPDSPDGKPYAAMFLQREESNNDNLWTKPPVVSCRNITIGKGAGLDGGARIVRGRQVYTSRPDLDEEVQIHGDVTVKDGGYIYGKLIFAGNQHTFFRVDKCPEPLCSEITVRKAEGAGVTLLARQYDLGRGVAVESGSLVLGPGTHLRFNATFKAREELGKCSPRYGLGTISRTKLPESYVFVRKGAALQMQAGSSLSRVLPPEDTVADVRIDGLLQIGLPGDAKGDPATIELVMGTGDGRFLGQPGGLYLRPTSEVNNFGKLSITASAVKGPAKANTGVSIFMEKLVDLGEVSIDYLRPGGIVVKDPDAAREALAKATFGPNCAARGDELFSRLKRIDFVGGMGTVEFVDGLATDCEILFPHAGRLIVRSKGNRITQSFDLKTVHSLTIDGKRTEFNAKRPLNATEKEHRRQNALWADVPDQGQYGKYGKQEWPDRPVMIWARPGTSGASFVGPNWLDETGTPYFEFPLISQRGDGSAAAIDMLLPAAAAPYVASGLGGRGSGGLPPHRHLTIEQNACYGIACNVHGNFWMKHGSGLSALHGAGAGRDVWGGGFDNIQPGLHRFLRFDGKRIPFRLGDIHAPLVDSRDAALSQYGYFSTGDGGTLELIGRIRSAADRLSIGGTGTMIISEGSELHEGSRSALWVQHGATLALLQDAFAGTEMTQQRPQCYASMIVGGTLMIGLRDKPIRRDMRFALSGIRKELISRSPGFSVRSTGSSFVLGQQGRFVIHSADPKNARVIFTMHDSKRAFARDAGYRAKASKARDMAYWNPEGIGCYFAGRTEVDGILFDRVYPGGIIVAPEARANWKNVFFGENNLAPPEQLYWYLKAEVLE